MLTRESWLSAAMKQNGNDAGSTPPASPSGQSERSLSQLVVIPQGSVGFGHTSTVFFSGTSFNIAVIVIIEAWLRLGTSILCDSFVYCAVNFIDWRIFVRHKNARTRNLQKDIKSGSYEPPLTKMKSNFWDGEVMAIHSPKPQKTSQQTANHAD